MSTPESVWDDARAHSVLGSPGNRLARELAAIEMAWHVADHTRATIAALVVVQQKLDAVIVLLDQIAKNTK